MVRKFLGPVFNLRFGHEIVLVFYYSLFAFLPDWTRKGKGEWLRGHSEARAFPLARPEAISENSFENAGLAGKTPSSPSQ